jgi:hypothetical protein
MPHMYAVRWADNKIVYFLSSGIGVRTTHVTRKLKSGDQVRVPCPELVALYNMYMAGVDSHDQLRLQRYSIQRATHLKKYYKTLFLGLIDLALVNAYIVAKEHRKKKNEPPLSHADFLMRLQAQLLALRNDDFARVPRMASNDDEEETAPFIPSTENQSHSICQTTDTVAGSGGKKRQRVCKVCSVLAGNTKRKHCTTFYCVECTQVNEGHHVFMCNVVRRTDEGNTSTCYQIWHNLWKNGEKIPQQANRIRRRKIEDGNDKILPDNETKSSKNHAEDDAVTEDIEDDAVTEDIEPAAETEDIEDDAETVDIEVDAETDDIEVDAETDDIEDDAEEDDQGDDEDNN